MITIILLILAFVAGCLITHFYWAPMHKAEIDAKDVLLDESKQARAWAEREYAVIKGKLAVFEEHVAVPSKPALPTPPAIPDPKLPQ
jgi:hypothetical protein